MELTRNLAVRDVETRYKHSFLGLYWTLINPLVTALIFSFVFQDIFHATSGSLPYVVFLLSGLTFWNFFANAVLSATSSVSGNAQLLAKVYFPRLVLPIAAVLARLIDLVFSSLVLLCFILAYHVPLHWTLLWLPIILSIQILFTLGVAYLVSSINVLYRDVSQLTGLLLLVWMYVSPVMYRVHKVPSGLRMVVLLNPMGSLLETERNLLFLGTVNHPAALWVAFTWAICFYAFGLWVFKKLEPIFAEVL